MSPMRRALLALPLLALARAPRAQGLAGIPAADQVSALRGALAQGAEAAVATLGTANGFWNNPKVRIPLPDPLERLRGPARLAGLSGQFDELHQSINRAAEAAVPEARALLAAAIRNLSVKDAQRILTGGPTAATDHFQRVTRADLFKRFLPIVSGVVEKVGLAHRYNALVERVAALGLVDRDKTQIQNYVTERALDALFLMVAEEERRIRADPVGAASDVVRRVFGVLGR
jgi:hypothetical protein